MGYVVGTDEAGYGPNLGPLVVSGTVWQVPDGVGGDDLYRLLEACVVSSPREVADGHSACIAIADSKVLYKPKSGLKHLERGLLAALGVLDRWPSSWREIWDALGADSAEARRSIPWYAGYDSPIPLDSDPTSARPLAAAINRGLAAADVRLIEVRSRAVFPEQFNNLVERHESKGAALSHTTLALAAELIEPLKQGPIRIICDKHGGRNRYNPLLTEHFPGRFIEVRGEGRQQSIYRFGPPDRRVEFCFRTKAESHLPVGLASMASKYLRELAMRAFNDFWLKRVPELCPTAGYPQDAKRFKGEIAEVQAELGIEDNVLWRTK